jgi:multisubunit Na+/H+ antiporter MnhE subunit
VDHHRAILKQEQRKPWHLPLIACACFLEGFVVAIFICLLILRFYPALSAGWRTLLLTAFTLVFGFAMLWARILDLKRREEAWRMGETIIEVPKRF